MKRGMRGGERKGEEVDRGEGGGGVCGTCKEKKMKNYFYRL